jgi:hypothetical protein
LGEESRQAGYGDLWDYNRDPKQPFLGTSTLALGAIGDPSDPVHSWEAVGLTESFWEWARKNTHFQADFGHSLVYISACFTDQTPLLRDILQARAYFAWDGAVWSSEAAAVGKYLIASLSRPTHSAEETFYNMVRINRTLQMIYVEDKMFDQELTASADLEHLRAYGWSPQSGTVDYRRAGWFGTEQSLGKSGFDGGQVWWLLFVERWSADPKDGRAKINECLHEFWQQGSLGGLKSPQCQNYNAGSLPKANEVGYASYLLDGGSTDGFDGTVVPRFTLHDSN